jgi:hypothetical protein
MNVRIRHTMPFTAGVFYGGEMRMNHYTASLHMITNSSDPASHNVAFERIKFFVYDCLDSTIFINAGAKEQCEKFMNAGLSITTLPGEPVDQLIGLMLYHKLNAIMCDRIVLEETEISSVLGENIVYSHCENEITDIDNIPNWWNLENPAHNDYVSLPVDKIVTMSTELAWRELDLSWPEIQTETNTGNIVVFADFKPGNETK